LVAQRVGPADDVAAVLVVRTQRTVGDPEELVVVGTQRGKPGDLTLAGGSADRNQVGHGARCSEWSMFDYRR
jgi:hypothetical protein